MKQGHARICATWWVKFFAAWLALSAIGAQADGNVAKSSIIIGQSLALTGPGSSLAVPYYQGAKLAFDQVNAEGGVGGRKIELITLDDAGVPATSAANSARLLAGGAVALFGYYGSAQVTASYPAVRQSDVLMFAPMAAADELRGDLFPNIYSLRLGYSEEAALITKHAETLGARKLVIVHGKDGESMAALESAERTMTSLGANLQAKIPLDAVDKVLATSPESVLVIGDAKGAANAIKSIRAKSFRGPIYGFSNTGESLLADELGAAGAGVIVVRVVPKSDGAKVALVREMQAQADLAKLGKTNVYMLEGYLAARVFTETLRRLGKTEPTRAKLRKVLDGSKEMNMGGIWVNFSEGRVGLKILDLSLIDSQGRVRE